jgi:thiamine pyrophosphate-dependent acetolactate synthase large subunit-like protein
VPVIFISGQVFASQTIQETGTRQIGVQEINIVDLVEKNTKWSTMMTNAKDVKVTLEKAHFNIFGYVYITYLMKISIYNYKLIF